ncbi:MAG: redoxin domain-containing protein [Lachnospiraceae bacterium]|nr:redoxin domain-containing protein [Lachnospiraceae bacterium]
MWNKIKTIVITVLATLGVLFIILMIIPVDEDDEAQVEQVAQASHDVQDPVETQDTQVTPEPQESTQLAEDEEEKPTTAPNAATVAVAIPASEISDNKLKFTTKTLDGKRVDQSIFADYDITLVHVWGTYCGPCISEMGKYAHYYDTIPDNVNIIGIVCDVYDGFDNNVDDANDILSDAGAGFMNLRTSDSVFDITQGIQVIPSSFFVDRDGNIIGEMMMGKHYDDTISRLNGYLR